MERSIKVLSLVVIVGVLVTSGLSAGDEKVTYYKISSRWQSKFFLYDNGGEVKYGEIKNDDSCLWSMDDDGQLLQVKNKATGNYMAIKDDGEKVICAPSDKKDTKAQWKLILIRSLTIALQNKSNNGFLNIEKLLGYPASDLKPTPSEQNWWSAQWVLTYVSGPKPPDELVFLIPGMVYVKSPEYGSDIKGETTVNIIAKGMTNAKVSCWHQPTEQKPEKYGFDSTVFEDIKLDGKGQGSFVFPADQFPHGPLNIKIHAWGKNRKNTCLLQVYNTGGVKWEAGAPAAPPPAAKGMKLVYIDDFDKPLSISATDTNAKYYSHKPGGGDFSGIKFSDFESAVNPFLQRDTYLRIRMDEKKNSAGLISVLKKDGSGFTVKAPCYFECRFTAQSAPGTWPAFWIMTKDVYRGLDKPADELDIIEAYGGWGEGNPKQYGYWIASHFWNQGPDGKSKDTTQKGFYGQIPMTKIGAGNRSTWFEAFHVYGCKVGMENTVYYCDDIEVARHPTAKLSKKDPFFFFINFASGGGWPTNLSRYDGIADMYVDYVRVYKGDN